MSQAKFIFPIILVLSVNYIQSNNAARILATVPMPFYSHQVAFRPIWKELAKRGHEIVLLTTDPMKDNIEKIKQIDLSFSYNIMKKYNYSYFATNQDNSNIHAFNEIFRGFSETFRKQLQHPEVHQLIHNKNEKFDLLMTEVLTPTYLGFAERFKVPIIGLSSFDVLQHIHEVMGNVVHPVLNPDGFMPYSYPPTFWQRLGSTLIQLAARLYGQYFILPMEEATNKIIFGENGRSLKDLCADMDMLFINVNPVLHTPRGLTPNTITFGGGTHVEANPEGLPEDLRNILDNSAEGVVYFSLGSNVKSNMLKDELKTIFLEVFAELPYKVLWKFESEYLSSKPENVIMKSWFPQTNILKHPNIKLFISQCGLQSLEEAIINQVPIVGLPFYGDQQQNGIVVQDKGMGKTLDIKSLTKEIFKEAILEVIGNSKYKKNVIETGILLRDTEMTGLEKVVWWTEYVLRHNGAKHLRNPVLHVPYYQYFLLDVLAFVFILTFIISWSTKRIFLKVYTKMYQRKNKIHSVINHDLD